MAVTLTMTGATGVTTVTPQFNFPSGTVAVEVDDVHIKYLTSGVPDSISLSVGEKLEYICSSYDVITRINLDGDKVSGDISGWDLPDDLDYLRLSNTSLSGSLATWSLPSGLTQLRLENSLVSGDISGWSLPSGLEQLYLSNTALSGDISAWTLPSTLVVLSLYSSSLSGDISGWTPGTSVTTLYLNDTALSGDISAWTWPTACSVLYADGTSVIYGSTNGSFKSINSTLAKIDLDGCGLDSWTVDRVVKDLADSGVSGKLLDIAGGNSGPSAAGKADIDALVSDGWTVSYNTTLTDTGSICFAANF